MSTCPKHLFPLLIALLFWLALPVTPVSAQDAGGDAAATRRSYDVPLLSSSALTTSFYRPQHVNTMELANLAQAFHGRDIYIEERGGLNARPIRNLQTLGDSLLIYDEPAMVARIQEWCALIDQPRQDEPAAPKPAPLVVREWRPGFISLQTAYRALQPFMRPVDVSDTTNDSPDMRVTQVNNISLLDEQGQLILRDTAQQVDEMLAVLDDIDHPDTQLLVTAMVLRGTADASAGAGVPAELVEDLSRLVPYEHFELLDMGIVRAASRGREIGVRMAAGNQLMLQPEAFDAATSTLTARCTFRMDSGFSLETRTSLASDEYTVLGASGSVPVFAVLRIVSLR